MLRDRYKQAPEETADLPETAQFLQNLRLKVFVGFVAALMMLYSFFGNIYRVPMQLEQHGSALVELKQNDEKHAERLSSMEKVFAAKEELFAEITRTRNRVEHLERLEANRVAMQQQMDRLEGVTKEITRLLDSTSIRLTELNAHMIALKETTADTKRALEDVKRKTP